MVIWFGAQFIVELGLGLVMNLWIDFVANFVGCVGLSYWVDANDYDLCTTGFEQYMGHLPR